MGCPDRRAAADVRKSPYERVRAIFIHYYGKFANRVLTFSDYSIASIDFKPPYILSGSSDKHIRLFDITSLQGWSTSPEYEHNPPPVAPFPLPFPYAYDSGTLPCAVCHVCGNIRDGAGSSNTGPGADGSVRNGAGRRVRGGDEPCTHGDLVRSVVLGE